MADYHVLTGRDDGNAYTVVFHIPIPDANNRVGIGYRTALVGSGLGGKTSLAEGDGVGQVTMAEKALIEAGAVYEYSEVFETNPNETAAQIRDRIDARYTSLVSQIQQRLANQLSYYGFTRDVG